VSTPTTRQDARLYECSDCGRWFAGDETVGCDECWTQRCQRCASVHLVHHQPGLEGRVGHPAAARQMTRPEARVARPVPA
jgi:hypothetical protein